eukprot:10254033-Lingulodinium_polyedra.AAC.1
MECARLQTVDSTASLCTALKPCRMMRSSQPSAAAAAANRTPHALHANASFGVRMSVRGVRFASRC